MLGAVSTHQKQAKKPDNRGCEGRIEMSLLNDLLRTPYGVIRTKEAKGGIINTRRSTDQPVLRI